MDPLGEWSTDANEALRVSLHLRGETGSPSQEIKSFHPKFTYPIFGENETIYGYKGLKVNLRFAANDLTPELDIAWDKRVPAVGDVEADDVDALMKEVLPENTLNTEADLHKHIQSTDPSIFTPPGTLLESYTLNSKTYEIFYSPLAACKSLFSNLQIFILLFIEGGSTLDLDDEPWVTNKWDVYFLYEKRQDSQYSFIGFCTVYRYWYFTPNTANKTITSSSPTIPTSTTPEPTRARISQFIILPPYQGKSHGGRFYDHIFSHLHADPAVQEITVEDPSEAFEDLRDTRDYNRLKRNGTFSQLSLSSIVSKTWDIRSMQRKNKIADRQFKSLVELELLRQLNRKDKKAYRQYKLFVKGRLYKHNIDALMQLDRLERIDKLDMTYLHVEEAYDRLLRKIEEGEPSGEDDGGNREKGDEERPRKRMRMRDGDED